MKRGLIVAIVLVGLMLLVAVALPFVISANSFLPALQQQLTATLGRKVTLGSLSVNLFEGGLTANALEIADDPAFSSLPFLQAQQLRVGVKWGPLLFHKELHITGLDIVNPKIQLLQAQNGRWNYSSLGAAAARSNPAGQQGNAPANTLAVDSIHLINGRAIVGVVPALTPSRVYDRIDLTIQSFSFSRAFPFNLTAQLPADGIVLLTGTAGPLNSADTSLTPFHADLHVQHLDPVAAGFLDKSAGISGLLDIKAQTSSDGVTVTSAGQVIGHSMQFSPHGAPTSTPLQLDYSTSYDLSSAIGSIAHTTLSSGQLQADLSGTYHLLPGHPQVQLRVDGKELSLDALQALLPAFGVKLPNGSVLQGGFLSTSLAIDGPLDDLVITGPVSLNGTRLSGYDLGSKLSAISALNSLGGGSGNVTEIQTLQADLRDTPQMLTASNLLVVVPSLGQATGNGTVQAGGQLNFNLLAKFSSSGGLGAIANGVMAALPGIFSKRVATDGIPLTIRGTTSNPVFNVDASVFSNLNGNSGAPQQSQPNSLGKALQGLFGSH